MKPFSLLVKPVSFDCNLRCRYCFYLRAQEVYGAGRHIMPDTVLEEMIRQLMGYGFRESVFGWQGGEPTLAGLNFFRRICDLQRKHGRSGQIVGNGLQTNATLIDADWAKFLARFNWLVGVSLDGPREIHNQFRRKAGGSETLHLVLRGLKHLQEAGVAVNALVLVSQANVKKAALVYRFLRDQKLDYLQFIPCVENDPATGKSADFAISGEEYGAFMLELFEAWKPDAGKVSVRDFDAIRRCLIDGNHDICTMGPCCDNYLLVEHTGDVYPCDFFMRPDWLLGNLMAKPLAEIYHSPRYREFGAIKGAHLAACDGCPWLQLCHGGCMKDREVSGDSSRVAASLCAGWKMFLPVAVPYFRGLDAVRKLPTGQGPSG